MESFFPHDNRRDNIKEINNHHLKGPLTTNNDNTNRKAIDAPI